MSHHRRSESARVPTSRNMWQSVGQPSEATAAQHAGANQKGHLTHRAHHTHQEGSFYEIFYKSIWPSGTPAAAQFSPGLASRSASKGRSDTAGADSLPGPHAHRVSQSSTSHSIWDSVSNTDSSPAQESIPAVSHFTGKSHSSKQLTRLGSTSRPTGPSRGHRRTASAAHMEHHQVESAASGSGSIAALYQAYLHGGAPAPLGAPAARTHRSNDTRAALASPSTSASPSGGKRPAKLGWTPPHARPAAPAGQRQARRRSAAQQSALRAHSPIQIHRNAAAKEGGPAPIQPQAAAVGPPQMPAAASRAAPGHKQHKSSLQLDTPAAEPPLEEASSSPGSEGVVPVASNHWHVVSAETSPASDQAPRVVTPHVRVSPLHATGRQGDPLPHGVQRASSAQQSTPSGTNINKEHAEQTPRTQNTHRRVRSADGASHTHSHLPEIWQDPPPNDFSGMDLSLTRLQAAIQDAGTDGATIRASTDGPLTIQEAATLAQDTETRQTQVVERGPINVAGESEAALATPPEQASPPQSPPAAAHVSTGTAGARRVAYSQQAPSVHSKAAVRDAIPSIRSSAGALKPVLSAVQMRPPTATAPGASRLDPAQNVKEHSRRVPRASPAVAPPTPPSRGAAEAAATIREAAKAKREQNRGDTPSFVPPSSVPLTRPVKRSAQFLAAQAGLQAVIAKQQAASIISPADSMSTRNTTRSVKTGLEPAVVSTSNPLAPGATTPVTHSLSAAAAGGGAGGVKSALRATGHRVLPPVPHRKTKTRPQSEPTPRGGVQGGVLVRPRAQTALSEKHANRRSAALNELISSEVVYISKLQQLVGAFEAKLAPGGAAGIAVPPPPPLIVGSGPFFLTSTDTNKQASPTQQGSLTPSSIQSGTPMASPEHIRSKSSGSRRFSWLGGARDPSTYLNAEQHSTLFRAVHTLLPLHFDLLQQLHEAVQAGTQAAETENTGSSALVAPSTAGCVEVGNVMLQFSPFFKMYNQYVAGHSAALTLLGELTATEGGFADWLRRMEMSPEGGGQTLASFLIMPVQRVPRYALLLKELLGQTPESHCDHGPMQKALGVVESSASRINTAISEHAFRQQVVQLQAALSPPPTPSLVGPSTRFVLAGWLNKVTGGTSTREYLVVLLSDCLVYASVSKNTASLQAHRAAYSQAMTAALKSSKELHSAVQRLELPLERGQLKLHNRLSVTSVEAKLDEEGRHCLQLQAHPKSVQFVCQGQLEAAMWQGTLQGVLQEQQALQERRRRGSVAPPASAEGGGAAVATGAAADE